MQTKARKLAIAAICDPLRLALLSERKIKRRQPYPNTDARRNYMRRYVADLRASETPEQREKRLASVREYMEKRYWKLKASNQSE